MNSLASKDHRYLWHPFTQMKDWLAEEPVIIESGDGPVLRDTEGREYLDANSSIWTNLHGHRHPRITAAIKEQLDRIAHCSFLGLSNPPAIELAERLCQLSGLSRVFYSDDGSTAVEVAIKMAFQYWQHRRRPHRRRFVAFTEAYHGDTLGAVSVSGIEIFRAPFRPLLFDVLRVSSLEELPSGEDVAAVIIEPLVQGAAGMKVWPRGLLRRLREWCDRTGALLIADEVMTGFGRTGTMFACQQEDVRPDLMALGKGLSGGYLPLAATLTTEEIFDAFLGEYGELKTFFHGHSYTGNPLGCAAALASLRIFEEERTLERLQPLSKQLAEGLQRCYTLAQVCNVRHCGFIGAVEVGPYPWTEKMGFRVCAEMRRRGVLTRPIGNAIIIMPPYCVTAAQLDRIITVLYEAILAVCR
ncbi:MAG: adenosylmethionine--8-amino-7-oxononanoate transaminase [Verrucomicrobiae bacterium]|nr:adenosylmethionine--8-amino-7-oxononanoate transaminase [Verrucomicrobiae bacterium]